MKDLGNLQKMLKTAKEMQERLQREMAEMRIDGTSGGGMVNVTLDGQKNLISVRLDPKSSNRDDIEMLQDLIVAAFNDAAGQGRRADGGQAEQPGRRTQDPGALLMFDYAQPLQRLIEELKRIPGIGAKTAQRIAFYILGLPQEDAERLAESIRRPGSRFSIARSATTSPTSTPVRCAPMEINATRTRSVSSRSPTTSRPSRRPGIYHGRYHVLLGNAGSASRRRPGRAPAGQARPERVEKGQFREVIIATNPTAEGRGDRPSTWPRSLRTHGVRLTRLAMGLPVGSDIDFADQVTIRKALEGRTELKE